MTSASGGQRSIQLSYGRRMTPEWMVPVSVRRLAPCEQRHRNRGRMIRAVGPHVHPPVTFRQLKTATHCANVQ